MIRFHEHPEENRSLTADYRPEEPVFQRMQEYFPDTSLYLTHSATVALEAIALLLDLSLEDEIILPSFTL